MYCRFCGKQIPEDSKFCLNCGKQTSVDSNEHTVPTNPSVIREVKISFKLLSGSYPSTSQYYKMFGSWQSEWEWNPSNIGLGTMKDILMKAINSFVENGWELIDKIDDELFIKDYFKDETPISKLGSFLSTNRDYTYKQTWTYYGARFHVKSTASVKQIPENSTININASDLDPSNFGIEPQKSIDNQLGKTLVETSKTYNSSPVKTRVYIYIFAGIIAGSVLGSLVDMLGLGLFLGFTIGFLGGLYIDLQQYK